MSIEGNFWTKHNREKQHTFFSSIFHLWFLCFASHFFVRMKLNEEIWKFVLSDMCIYERFFLQAFSLFLFICESNFNGLIKIRFRFSVVAQYIKSITNIKFPCWTMSSVCVYFVRRTNSRNSCIQKYFQRLWDVRPSEDMYFNFKFS